jgi:hypothetical protein
MSATRRNFLSPEPPPRDEAPDYWGAMPLDDFGDDVAPPPPKPLETSTPEPSPNNAPELTAEGMAGELIATPCHHSRHVRQ